MMKNAILILLPTLLSAHSFAQAPVYPARAIPDSMLKNANVVLREEYRKLTVKSSNSAKFEVHDVLTILNEQGRNYLFFNQFSDKFEVLDDAEFIVYDTEGNKIKTYEKKNMNSINYGEGLVPEGKMTYFSPNAPSFPITVEINYTIKFKGIIGLPGFIIQPSGQSVQHEVFEVETPADLGIRYKMINTNREPVKTDDGAKQLYRWEVRNLVAYQYEKQSGSAYNYEPAVLIGPVKFQMDEYEGDMTSWKNFGTWMNELYEKTTVLPEEKKRFYRNLVKDATSDEEKARIIYRYLQDNMRYVSIQLGIGGLQPFPASFVDEKKYGDCKALSNFLRSALDAVNIKSSVLIIQGGVEPRKVYAEFPADYFNHVILCIPHPKDTVWLECTSSILPFGELGPFTENRKAMMITDSGGVLVNTPKSNYNENLENFTSRIEVDAEGGAKVITNWSSTGEQRFELLSRFHDLKEDEKKTYFIRENEWKQPDLFNISNSGKRDNPYRVTAKMEYEKISSFTAGKKLFLAPMLYSIFDEDIPETEKRTHAYLFTCPYQSTDTTIYTFPAGFAVENLPANKSIEMPFAVYHCTSTLDANSRTLTIVSLLQIREREIKAAEYPQLLDFKKQVKGSVNEKIVVRRD